MVEKSYEEINQRIKDGDAVVVTAEELVELVREKGAGQVTREVDVVTTGTFGTMCSSGAWLNFGHSDPPIKMQRAWLNDVEAYTGVAAVDAYLGATQLSETREMEYGGGHVLQDLVDGKAIELRAVGYGTDCYPRKEIETAITINDLNQVLLCNPRNVYQRYNAATNSNDEIVHTYMGTLLPNYGNVTFSGAGVLNPLSRDPDYKTIGIGTRIFIGGAQGYVVGPGTQHNPASGFGTIMVMGDMKEMSSRYLRGCTIYGYGTSLFLGVGIPIPLLNERIAEKAAIPEEQLITEIVDYGTPRRERPVVKKVSYAELRSGAVEIGGKEVPVSPLSSFKLAREIAGRLKEWISKGQFYLSPPVERLPNDTRFNPMKQAERPQLIHEIMTKDVVVAGLEDSITKAAKIFAERGFDHLPAADKEGKLVGIITSWDVAVAVGTGKRRISEIMSRKVVTAREDEPVEAAARRLEQHEISGLPVTDKEGFIKGIITTEDISKLVGRRK